MTNNYTIMQFPEKNENKCMIYSTIKNNDDGLEYFSTVYIKLPTTNIITHVVNKKNIDCIISLKNKNINTYDAFKYSRGVFINSSDYVYCTITPQARKLDLQINKNILDTIKNKNLSEKKSEQLTKYLDNFSYLQGQCDYNKLLIKEYKYYYCLYKYLLENDNNISDEGFEQFIKNCIIEINTDEQYIEEIKKLTINGQEKPEYNFIRCSENFILLPVYNNAYNSIITINDIFLLKNKSYYGSIKYCDTKIQIFYRNKKPINNIIDVGNMIENGEYSLDEWLDLLSEIKNEIFDYYEILFRMKDCKTQLSRENPELLEGFETDIVITTVVHPKNKCFYFGAYYNTDGFGKSSIREEYISTINIYNLEMYSKMGILKKLTYNIIAKKKHVPVYYYDTDIITLNSPDITDVMKEEFNNSNIKDIVLNMRNVKKYIPPHLRKDQKWINGVPVPITNKTNLSKPVKKDYLEEQWKHLSPITHNSNKNLSKNHIKGGNILSLSNKKYIIIKKGGLNIINKINDDGSLKNISRDELLEKIKIIIWDGSITLSNCDIRIYGYIFINNIKKNYVLYIIPHKINNNNISNIFSNMKNMFENVFFYYVNYDLYLHQIINIEDSELKRGINSEIDSIIVSDIEGEIDSNMGSEIEGDIDSEIEEDIDSEIEEDIDSETDSDVGSETYGETVSKIDDKLDIKINGEKKNIIKINEEDISDVISDNDKNNKSFNYKEIEQKEDKERKYVTIKIDNTIRKLIKDTVLAQNKRENDNKEIFTIDVLYKGEKDRERYINANIKSKSFPIKLIKAGIFNFTRFFMVTDKEGKKPKLINSAEIKKIKLENIIPGPVEYSEDKSKINYAQVAFIMNADNVIDYTIDDDVDIEKLKDSGLSRLIIEMIEYGLKKNNFFKFTGFLFPWRGKLFDLFELRDDDFEYIVKLFNNVIESMILFVNGLGIKGLYINKNHISIYFHYPASHEGIHFQLKFFKIENILTIDHSKKKNI